MLATYDDYAGEVVGGAGDVDGDGFDDVLVGAVGAESDDSVAGGAACLFLGPLTGEHPLSDADARLLGESDGDMAGSTLATAGDVDGDGLADVLVAADHCDYYGDDEHDGAVYLLQGPLAGDISLSDADATFTAGGGSTGGGLGRGMCSAGDVDGDGLDDLLLGESYSDANGNEAGVAYLVQSPASGLLDLAGADAHLLGEAEVDHAGGSVAACDMDTDGHSDLLIGSSNDEAGEEAGAIYLLYGAVSGEVLLADADAKLRGSAGDWAANVTAGGDLDADGLPDLLVGATGYTVDDESVGALFVVLLADLLP